MINRNTLPIKNLRSLLTGLTLFLVLAGSSTSWSQTSAGSIRGTVRDKTGASVAKASITLTQLDTGRTIQQNTDDAGLFALFALSPGDYKIVCSSNGFKTSVVDHIAVNTAQVAAVDIVLAVGSVSAQVVVTADSGMISTDTPTFTSTVSSDIMQNTPLPDRSALELAVFTAGVVGDPQFENGSQSEVPGIYLNAATPGASFSIGGGRPGLASQLVDGFDTTLNAYPRAGVTLSKDTSESITVQQNGLEAEYGRTGGGILNQATRSGGSQYHGSVSYRNIQPSWEGYTYASTVRPLLKQTESSYYLSGPVPLWGLIHDKPGLTHSTFFLVTVEPQWQSNQVFTRGRLMTPDELAGRLNNSLDLLNTSILASSGYAAAVAAPRLSNVYYQYKLNAAGFPTGSQLASSQYVQVPNNDLSAQVAANPLAKAIYSYMPQPGVASNYYKFFYPDGSYATDGNNALVARGVVSTDDRYSFRIDQGFGQSDKFFARYTLVPVTGDRYNFAGPNSPINAIGGDNYTTHDVALGETHIFRANIVNELRISYLRSNREHQPDPAALSKDWGASLGLLPAVDGMGFPGISGLPQNVGSGGSASDSGRSIDINSGLGDDVSILRGKHSFKFGTEILDLNLDRKDNQYLIGGQYSFSSALSNNGSGGSNQASFDLGLISNFTSATVQPYYYTWKYYAVYGQDEWQVLPKLTLNLGLRYNLETPRKEKYGLQGSWDPNFTGSFNGVAATGALTLSGKNGRINTLWPTNFLGFEPRVGFAYEVNSNTTVRGGFALVHAPLTGVGNEVAPNLAPAAQSVGPTTGGVNAGQLDYITNPVAPIPYIPSLTSSPIFNLAGSAALPFVDQSKSVPYVQMWSLIVSRTIGRNSLELSYVGNKGTHLYTDSNGSSLALNVPPLTSLISGIQKGLNFSSNSIPNPYGLGNENYLLSLNPFQQVYNNPILIFYRRTASSSYHGVYISGARSMYHGISAFGSFAWTKSLDNASDNTYDLTNIYGEDLPQSPYTPLNKSYSAFDTPLRASGGYTVEFPFGRGKLVNIKNPILDKIVGGWVTTGLVSSQDGFPFYAVLGTPGYFFSTLPGSSIYGSGGTAISAANIRPNLVPGVPLIKSGWRRDPTGVNPVTGGFANPAAFAVPGSPGNPQFGNAPRFLGNLRSPIVTYYDMTLRKTTPLWTERVKLQLQLDAINALNHPNFVFNPNTGHSLSGGLNTTTGVYATASNFGILPASNVTEGRLIAIGGKLIF